ncbi:MAG: hypothetical protein P1Q69_16180 [Candidatus Thorarchaeota archaeon]|nr:hypothetical protein [Candidatus Thorarchaeota archaeon]
MVYVLPDATNPTINHPDDIFYEVNSTGYTITWVPYDENPHYYEIFKDGSLLTWGWWNSSSETIQISVDGLPLGQHIYRMTVSDAYWNNATDYVNVTVVSQLIAVDSPPDIEYVVGTTGNNITWIVISSTPSYIEIYRNSITIVSRVWEEPMYILSVDHLTTGNFNFTIKVWSSVGDSDYDTVWVTVTADTTTSTTTSTSTSTTDTTNSTVPEFPEYFSILVLTITLGSGVVIVLVIILIYRSRSTASFTFEYS